jgi:uncharacterized damage-inducible protein DinB
MSVFTNPASGSAGQAASYIAAVLELLGSKDPTEVLCGTPPALRKTLNGNTRSQITTPEAPGKWSVRQVVQHLADSELVWSYRLRMVLSQERPRLTGYDQDLWTERLHYYDADCTQALAEFTLLRESNLRLLGRATPRDLERVGIHDERGEESVSHMMRLYAGHDILHLRQIGRILRTLDASK